MMSPARARERLARDRLTLLLAALAVLLTRLPWIGSGYGSDPDGYRVVIAARQIAHSGVYEASRLPGYPVYEYLTALSAMASPWVSNAVTALLSVAAFVCFALIVRELGVRRYLLVALAFAMTPVIYVSSCCTIDYIPAVAGQLAATYAVLRRRPVLAGLLLGLAVGCRITAGALALPLCLWMLLTAAPRPALRQCFAFGITLLAVSVLVFVPVWRRYSADFFAFYDNGWYPPLDVVATRALPLVWGPLGLAALVALLCAAPAYAGFTRRALGEARTRSALVLAFAAIALYLIAFLRLPDEAGYLVPAVPFVLLSIALLTPPWAAGALAVALMLSSWIGCNHARPSLEGPIVEDHLVRESQQRSTAAVIDAVGRLAGRATIVSGWVLPRITLALGGAREGPHQFIYLVENLGDYQHYVAEGWTLYYLPGVDLYESQAHDLELPELGARQLAVARERQRPASTGE
ncbi:MAG: hypothetical protein ACHQDD_00690 [Steroidobacterales bacterium]